MKNVFSRSFKLKNLKRERDYEKIINTLRIIKKNLNPIHQNSHKKEILP